MHNQRLHKHIGFMADILSTWKGVFKLFVLVNLALLSPVSSAEKKSRSLSFPEAKAHYLVEMLKKVYWSKEQDISRFNIGVLGGSKAFVKAFESNYGSENIRGKALHIEQINSDINVNYYHVVYVQPPKLASIHKINLTYPNALIITDGEVSKANRVVSFISGYDNIEVQFNLDHLYERNFSVSNNLLFFAGSKRDLEKQLAVKDNILNSLYAEIKSKEIELDKISKILAKNNKLLREVESKLSNKETQLQQSNNDLIVLQTEKETIYEAISQSQNRLKEQNHIINEKIIKQESVEMQLGYLQENIAYNQVVLNQQLADLETQKAQINQQIGVIDQQRTLLYISAIFLILILVFSFFLWHLNRLRRKSNKALYLLNEQLYETATTDGMTKLYNRRHFVESAQIQIAQLKRTGYDGSVLMMDIDFFKTVNDRYGHAMGDQAIIAVANVFRENLRQHDLLGRLGGEEFSMLIANCPLEKVLEIAERLRAEVEKMDVVFQSNMVNLTISIGVARLSSEDDNIENVLQRADQALYQAKNSGRNKVHLY